MLTRFDRTFMMKPVGQIFISLLIILISCTPTEKCPEGVNLLPMYGGQTKCEE